MRIQIIWIVLLAILTTSDADRAMAQERINTSKISTAAKAELSEALVHGSELRDRSPVPRKRVTPLGNCRACRDGSWC